MDRINRPYTQPTQSDHQLPSGKTGAIAGGGAAAASPEAPEQKIDTRAIVLIPGDRTRQRKPTDDKAKDTASPAQRFLGNVLGVVKGAFNGIANMFGTKTEHTGTAAVASKKPWEGKTGPVAMLDPLKDSEKYNNVLDSVSEIYPGKIYLSGMAPAGELLDMSGFNVVIKCTHRSHEPENKVRGRVIDLGDLADDSSDWPQILNAIEQHKVYDALDAAIKGTSGRTLVHCTNGQSRSATVLIAYLMARHGLNADEAYNYVARCRPVLMVRFMDQLREYERQLRDTAQQGA